MDASALALPVRVPGNILFLLLFIFVAITHVSFASASAYVTPGCNLTNIVSQATSQTKNHERPSSVPSHLSRPPTAASIHPNQPRN